MVMCGRPKVTAVRGGVRGWWSVARCAGRSYSATRCLGCSQIGQREAGVGCPQRLSSGGRRAGRSSGEGPEGLSGPELEGSQRCTSAGWSSRRRRSAGWWPEEVVLGGPGCSSQRRHGARRKQRRGMSGRRRSKRVSSSAGCSPYSRTRRWPRATEPVSGEYGGQ
jgi:hypothetical protein